MAKNIETKLVPNENVKPVLEIWANQKHKNTTLSIKSKWWFQDETDLHRHVYAVAEGIEKNQMYRETQNIRYARLYANMEILGFAAGVFSKTATDNNFFNRISLNVVKSCIDTASAKISKNKPKPLFLTEAGDYSLQSKAKKLTKYVEGVFDSGDLYTLSQDTFRDSCVWGLGAIKIYTEDNQIKFERVLPHELLVDDAEGIYAKPRQIHQKKYIHREILIDMFPQHTQEILSAKSGSKGDLLIRSASDQVVVLESWHLPSGPDTKDGRHVIVLENVTLFSERYDKPYFPFVFFRWSNRLLGFYGQGLAEELIGIQLRINKLLKNVETAQELMSVPRIFIENSSEIVMSHINNEIGGIVRYTGTAPITSVAPAVSPEIYSYLQDLYNKAYEITGISQMNAQSIKPAGLNSGAALREYDDIQSERFILVGMRWEKMFIDISEIVVDMSRDLYLENKNLKVKVKGSKFIETIKWKDVDMEDDKFSLQVYPISSLPSTPAGKLQSVQELAQAGFIGKEEAMSLLDYPDLEAFNDRNNAPLDLAKKLIENMMDNGVYKPPEPFMNLQLTLTTTQYAYAFAELQNVSEDRLELLRRFMTDCQALMRAATAPPPEQPGTNSGQPQAVPDPRPQSDLLPQTMPVS